MGQTSFKKLETWARSRGYSLVPGRSYVCYKEDRTIHYRPGDRPMTQVIGILHECGHVLCDRAIQTQTITPRFKRGYPCPWTGKARPNVSAADLVHEEIEAWHRGYALARRLRLRLDRVAFWHEYGRSIKSYFRSMIKRNL